MDETTFRELELDRVLELAANLAASPMGRARVRTLRPATVAAEIDERLDATAELLARLTREGSLAFPDLDGLDEPLEALRRQEEILAFDEFRALFALVRCLVGLERALAGEPADTWLGARARELPDLRELDRLRAAWFDEDGRLRDDASPELVAIRRRLGARRAAAHARAEAILRDHADAFRDATVVVRDERYCLPLRADARGRIAAVVHDRSQSGQTFFAEPLELVEANNEVATLRDDETREIRRLLVEATARLAAHREPLEAGLEVATELDAAQARARFASLTEANRPTIGAELPFEIRSARHPLLDERLAPLRRQVFGEDADRAGRAVVPVDLVLSPSTRVALLTGPNAGGKTATLKLLGLFAAMAQCGFFLPAAPGTRFRLLSRLSSHIGDSQNLLADESSFSSYMVRLARLLPELDPASLVLLDELGSATDPEEGGALAAALLEEIAAKGATAVATTHLSLLKRQAEETDGFLVVAMEIDADTGRPTFRVRPGETGRSFALALAERAALPTRVLARARALLGSDWERRERAAEELATEREAARAARRAADEARERAEAEAARLAVEREKSAAVGRELRAGFRREMDRLRKVVDEAVTRGLDSLAARLADKTVGRRALEREAAKVRAEALAEAEASITLPEEPIDVGPPVVGEAIELVGLGVVGTLRSLDEKEAVVELRGKVVRLPPADVRRPASRATADVPAPRSATRAAVSFAASRPAEVAGEINLLGKTVDEAIALLDDYLDRALVQGLSEVRVIHGFGTGRLRRGLERYLARHPSVKATRLGEAGEGGGGATVVTLL